MSDIENLLLGAFLGSLLSIVSGFLAEEAKKRRRMWATARTLLYELQRVWESAESRDSLTVLKALQPVIEDYKQALFAVDRVKFEEHWEVYRDLIRILDSNGEPSYKETLLVLDIRRRLAAIVGAEQPGAGERLGVPEKGSPVSWDAPDNKRRDG